MTRKVDFKWFTEDRQTYDIIPKKKRVEKRVEKTGRNREVQGESYSERERERYKERDAKREMHREFLQVTRKEREIKRGGQDKRDMERDLGRAED